jgi:outer membrane protein assembly factor BamB
MTTRMNSGWRKATSAAIAVVIALFASLAVTGGPASASSASLALSKASGPPTSVITVTGTGFTPLKSVSVSFDGATAATAGSDSLGDFTAVVTVPKGTLPGSYVVAASDSLLSATATFIVRTNWAMFSFNDAATGTNPYENILGVGNVHTLTQFGTGALVPDDGVNTSPVVYNGTVFVKGSSGTIYAFSQSCLAAAQACAPLWTATGADGTGEMAVVNGVLFAANSAQTGFDAFSAPGNSAFCTGAPKVCRPMWTGAMPFRDAEEAEAPVVFNNTLYMAGGAHARTLFAFSTIPASSRCTVPASGLRTCKPLWSARLENDAAHGVTVSGGVVYVSAGLLYAFSAVATAANCTTTGTATMCNPLWTGTTEVSIGQPVVAAGKVFVESQTANLYQYPAGGGGPNCTGPMSARVCNPLWGTASGVVNATPAFAKGILYAVGGSAELEALNASTGNLVWETQTAAVEGRITPVVANGVVYVGGGLGGRLVGGHLAAYKATLSANCVEPGPVCAPFYVSQPSIAIVSAVVVDGSVYVSGNPSGTKVSVYHT